MVLPRARSQHSSVCVTVRAGPAAFIGAAAFQHGQNAPAVPGLSEHAGSSVLNTSSKDIHRILTCTVV